MLTLSGDARVVGIEEELVDMTRIGAEDPDYVPGQRIVKLLITKAKASRR